MQLRGRSVWLIGASSGIGAALALELAAEGCVLALSARREDELKQVADEAALRGSRPVVKPVDVRDLDAMRRSYGELKQLWGRIDVLFYNVGIPSRSDVDHFEIESVVNQIDVNFSGLVRAIGLVMPDMIANRTGEILGTASVVGYAGMPRAAGYSASKVAEIAFLQAIRMELRPHGVGVTTVNPGFVRTPLTENNGFRMPFIMEAEEAARRIVSGMLAGEAEIHFPKRVSWPLKAATALPRSLYEALAYRVMRVR